MYSAATVFQLNIPISTFSVSINELTRELFFRSRN